LGHKGGLCLAKFVQELPEEPLLYCGYTLQLRKRCDGKTLDHIPRGTLHRLADGYPLHWGASSARTGLPGGHFDNPGGSGRLQLQ